MEIPRAHSYVIITGTNRLTFSLVKLDLKGFFIRFNGTLVGNQFLT